jgi:hypothetical protein
MTTQCYARPPGVASGIALGFRLETSRWEHAGRNNDVIPRGNPMSIFNRRKFLRHSVWPAACGSALAGRAVESISQAAADDFNSDVLVMGPIALGELFERMDQWREGVDDRDFFATKGGPKRKAIQTALDKCQVYVLDHLGKFIYSTEVHGTGTSGESLPHCLVKGVFTHELRGEKDQPFMLHVHEVDFLDTNRIVVPKAKHLHACHCWLRFRVTLRTSQLDADAASKVDAREAVGWTYVFTTEAMEYRPDGSWKWGRSERPR